MSQKTGQEAVITGRKPGGALHHLSPPGPLARQHTTT